MPRFRVIEKRAYNHRVLIDAANEDAAQNYQGEIVDEIEEDSYGDELLSVEEVDAAEDEA